KGSAIDRIAAATAPLALLWAWVVQDAPWLPDRLPLLLVLAGPLRWAVAPAAIAGLVFRRVPVIDWTKTPRRRTVFAASLILYLIFGLRSARAIGPAGDEPHYLIIAQSLLADGDLQIENNHRNQEYRSFYTAGELRPDYMRRGANGRIYSIHAPGLPALLLPAYALGGYRAVVAIL